MESNGAHLPATLAAAKTSHVAIYCVAILNENFFGQNPKALKKVSEASGGEFYLPQTVPQGNTSKNVASSLFTVATSLS